MRAVPATLRLARQLHAFDPANLPQAVREQAFLCLADTLLVAAGGLQQPANSALRMAVPCSSGDCRVWFSDERTVGMQEAAFINSLHAGSLGFDGFNGKVQASRVCLPAAWAAAEHTGRSGAELLQAFILASEVMSRLARSAKGKDAGWAETAIYGCVGSAVAAGILLDLTTAQLAHAMGLAMAQAAGTRQASLESVTSRHLQPAFAARNGVFAAQLAAAGATAPSQALEGPLGLRALYQSGHDRQLFDGLFVDWQFQGTTLKRFPTSAFGHAAIEALLQLQPERYEETEVLQVVAYLSPSAFRYVGAEFNPQESADVLAQYNLRYHLASVFLRGPLTLAHQSTEAMADPAILRMVRKVHLRISPKNDCNYAPASVSLLLANGQERRYTQSELPGSPALPLSAEQQQEKALTCAAAGNIDLPAFQSRLAELSAIEDVRQFWSPAGNRKLHLVPRHLKAEV